jgi:predicted deacylase
MNRMTVGPDALDFQTRGRRDYWVKLEHTTIWAHHLIPVTVIVGPEAKPGRGLLATGSTHGDEIEGPVALKHLVREIRTEDVLGRLVLVPVLNVMAFKANRRESPDDGVNLNRAFPGDARGSVTYRLADFVTRFLFPQVHSVFDIHSGGEVARFCPTANIHSMKDPVQRRAMEEAARGFGTKFVMVYQNLTPGLLTALAEDLGKITVGTEMGWGRAVQAPGVSMARQGILTAAVKQGVLRGEPPPNRHCPAGEQIMVDTADPLCSFLAPFEGLFEPTVELGARVTKGQRVGFLHDFNRIDEAPFEIPAPHDGYVICQAWNARVLQGQVISQVGKPLEWTR